MPGRRYYCYYCDASFPYSREARKRHNTGHTHARLAAKHYQQYHNARERYNTETSKEKCRKFLSGTGCNYGHECIYSHTTPQELHELRLKAEEEAILEEYGPLPSQVTSPLSTPSATNILALDSTAVTKIIVAQCRKRLLSQYPAQLLPHTATATNNKTCQNSSGPPSLGITGIEGESSSSFLTHKSHWSSDAACEVNAALPGSIDITLSSISFEGEPDMTRPPPIKTDGSKLLPPSMLPYTLDMMLSKPLPEWG